MTAPRTRRRRSPWPAAGLALPLALGACAGGDAELTAPELGYDPAAVTPFTGSYACRKAPRGRYETRFRWRHSAGSLGEDPFEVTAAGTVEVAIEADRAVVDYAVTGIELDGRAFTAGARPFFTIHQVVPDDDGADPAIRTAFGDLGALPRAAVAAIREQLTGEAPMGAPFLPQENFAFAMGEAATIDVPTEKFGAGVEDLGLDVSAEVVGRTMLDMGPAVVFRARGDGSAKYRGVPVTFAISAVLFFDPETCALIASRFAADGRFRIDGRSWRYRLAETLWTYGWRGTPSELVLGPSAAAPSAGAGAQR